MGPYKIGVLFAVLFAIFLLLIILNVFGYIGQVHIIDYDIRNVTSSAAADQNKYYYYYYYLNISNSTG